MNCKEFQECACEIVDKRLSEKETEELLQHANVCPHCQFELHTLQTSKNIVSESLLRQSVPSDVYYSILNKTVNAPNTVFSFGKLFPKLNPVLISIALLVVAVGIYSIFFSTSSLSKESNIINQSLANYQAVMGGSFEPQLISDHESVRTFLENEVHFSVNVPKVKKCKSYSGKCSDFKGLKFAHVNFKLNDNMVYIFQADLDEVMKGDKIGIPAEAKTALAATNWYIKEISANQTLVLWTYKKTICAAVSNMKKDQLVAMLSEKDSQ
jgi:hypothetical protein